MRRKPHESALGLILKKQKRKRHAKQPHISKFRKIVQMRKSRQNAKCKVLQIKQSFSRPQMAVRKKTKVFFLTPTKKLKLRMACGLEKDVPGSEKREAVVCLDDSWRSNCFLVRAYLLLAVTQCVHHGTLSALRQLVLRPTQGSIATRNLQGAPAMSVSGTSWFQSDWQLKH